MSARAARWLAWSLAALSAALAATGAVLNAVGHPTHEDLDYNAVFAAAFLAFSVVGALVAARLSTNPIGWLLLTQGLCWELSGALAGYANWALFAHPGSWPGGQLAAWSLNWLYIPAIGAAILLFLLFPDGRTASPRWRPVLWAVAVGIGLTFVANALAPGPMRAVPSVTNPFGLDGWRGALDLLSTAGNVLISVASVLAVASMFVRYRSTRGIERQQLKWLAFAALVVVVAFSLYNVFVAIHLPGVADAVGPTSLLAIPIAVGIAILRYRLYDIDIVIDRTVVFGGLVVFITAIYVALVVGIGALVGNGFGSNVALAVVATALIAVAFQPVRSRLERAARRLVFGPPSAAEARAGVAIECLGAFRVFRDGDLVPLTAWQSKKARTLLKILVARRGRATPREVLMEALWPDEGPAATTRRLSVALATVRSVLDPDKRHPPDQFVAGDKDAVRIDLSHVPVDVERFLSAAAEGLRRSGPQAVAALEAAEALYGGDFLEEDRYDDWAVPLREEARLAFVAVTRALGDAAASAGEADRAVRYHLRVLEGDPWDEEAHLAVVRTLERAGRHGEARRHYRRYVTRMEELQVPAAPFPVGT